MILAAPVVDGHDLTNHLIESLQGVVQSDRFVFVIVDNASETPYRHEDYAYSKFPVHVIRNDVNRGYYFPLVQLLNTYQDEEIGLIHNDMVLYEEGWDVRMAKAFEYDPHLGLIGLCGSNEIDERGGRGGGTMCFFRGADVTFGSTTLKGQDQSAGLRISDLRAACTLDSLFMMFRRGVIPELMSSAANDSWGDVTLAHFYDRIWPLRTLEAGYRVAVLGVECDHLGGMTCVANQRYYDDCVKWLEERNIPYENPETEMYLVAERRYLGEYRDVKRFIPCRVSADHLIGRP